MSDVINFKDRQPPPPPSPSTNDWILQLVTDWKIARAEQEIEWAQHQLAIQWGNIPDAHIPSPTNKALEQMLECEGHLANLEPRNMIAARALLDVAIEILAYRQINPESYFANGPVLELVRNVRLAIDWVNGFTPTCKPEKD